jgi:Protein of unknown function (DUF992)
MNQPSELGHYRNYRLGWRNEYGVIMKRVSSAFGIAVATVSLMSAPAFAAREQVGTLRCEVAPGVGFVVGSRKAVRCEFARAGQKPEYYVGSIDRYGLDVGATAGGTIVWGVHIETTQRRYALTGGYGGASAQATVAVGLGANVLVGGSDSTIALQPLAVEGQTGLNVAAGIAELTLRPAQPSRRATGRSR